MRSSGFLVKGLGCRQWNIWLHTPALPSFQVSSVSARQPVLATRVTPVVRHVVVKHLLVLFICLGVLLSINLAADTLFLGLVEHRAASLGEEAW